MKIKRAILVGIVLLVLLLIISVIRTGLAALDSDGVSFVGFRTNAAGHLEASYVVPLPDDLRVLRTLRVQYLRGDLWTNSVPFQLERTDNEPTRVVVPLTVGGEPPHPGEVCRVVSAVAFVSRELRLRRMLHRVWPTNAPRRGYDRIRWSTNDLIIPPTILPGRPDQK